MLPRLRRRSPLWLGVPDVIGCANGTDAIYIALRILGIGAGDEVITTAHSWIATSETVSPKPVRRRCSSTWMTFTRSTSMPLKQPSLREPVR